MGIEANAREPLRDRLFIAVLSKVYGEVLTPEEARTLLDAKTSKHQSEGQLLEKTRIGQKIVGAGITLQSLAERTQEVLAPLTEIERDVAMVSLGMTACGPTPTRSETARTVSRSIKSLPRIERRALAKLQAV